MNIKSHADKNGAPSIHELHLNPEPFNMIKNGRKTVEIRLNDEKRKAIVPGDLIRFFLRGSEEMILARVTALYVAPSFEVLFEVGGLLNKGGWQATTPKAAAEDMCKYYSQEREAENGALAIEFTILLSTPAETPIITL